MFAQFPPVSTEAWESVITTDLKGADYERKLVWKTAEGFNVRPYYRAENLAGIQFLGSEGGEFPYVRGTKSNNSWLIHQTFLVENVAEANAAALTSLGKGAESIGFTINSENLTAAQLDTLLSGINNAEVEVVFDGTAAAHVADLFIEKVLRETPDPESVRVSFAIDPVMLKATLRGNMCPEGECPCFDRVAALKLRVPQYKRIRFVSVHGHAFHNAGSTIVQELAFTLAAGHEYVAKCIEAGLSADQAAANLRFSMAISSNYFMEMAKFRAARLLWANIVAPYNPTCACASKMKIHAVTSSWNQTVYDPYVNMLRGTTEAMSAAIAGVHSIEVLPFDAPYAAPSAFSSRIARNTQLLLKEESHFDQVVDPAGGSYYIEVLTQSIAEQAWALFKTIEEKGGYLKALRAGFIQEQVAASAAKKDLNIATRREILLGSNQYPNFTEEAEAAITPEVVSNLCTDAACGCKSNGEDPNKVEPLRPYRGAMAFEQMRLRVDRSAKSPEAFMLTAGSLAFARARAQFACNFFACAGIRVTDNTYFASVAEGAEAAIAAGAQIVVLCASDDDYATLALEAAKLLAGKAILVVAGDPACRADLEAAGINHFISVKSNVLETLQGYLKELGI